MSKSKFRNQIDDALELYEAGRTTAYVAVLTGIYQLIPPSDDAALGLVGALFRKADETEKARYCYRKLLDVDPLSCRASLGLFHTLWRAGLHGDAFDELERFFRLIEMHERQDLIEEDGEHLRLIEEMRRGFFGRKTNRSDDPLTVIAKLRAAQLDDK